MTDEGVYKEEEVEEESLSSEEGVKVAAEVIEATFPVEPSDVTLSRRRFMSLVYIYLQ